MHCVPDLCFCKAKRTPGKASRPCDVDMSYAATDLARPRWRPMHGRSSVSLGLSGQCCVFDATRGSREVRAAVYEDRPAVDVRAVANSARNLPVRASSWRTRRARIRFYSERQLSSRRGNTMDTMDTNPLIDLHRVLRDRVLRVRLIRQSK